MLKVFEPLRLDPSSCAFFNGVSLIGHRAQGKGLGSSDVFFLFESHFNGLIKWCALLHTCVGTLA